MSQYSLIFFIFQSHPYLFTAVNSPKDAVLDAPLEKDVQNAPTGKSSSARKIALGIGLTSFFVLIVVAVIILLRKHRRMPISARIRILAKPWRRMKEKI